MIRWFITLAVLIFLCMNGLGIIEHIIDHTRHKASMDYLFLLLEIIALSLCICWNDIKTFGE